MRCLGPAPFWFLVLCVIGLSGSGCGRRAPQSVESGNLRVAGIGRAARRDLPQLVSIAREGDPYIAAALAIRHRAGIATSVAIGSLLERRLAAAGIPALATTNDLGLIVLARIADAGRVDSFVETAVTTLREPAGSVAVDETALRRAASQRASGPLAHCLGLAAQRSIEPVTLARFRAWQQSLAPSSVALSIVGPESAVRDAQDAHRALAPWVGPEQVPPKEVKVDWPNRDEIEYGSSIDGQSHLTVAIRQPTTAVAYATLDALDRSDSDLALRLQNYPGGFRVQSAGLVTLPFGACLHVQLAAEGTANSSDAARVIGELVEPVIDDDGSWMVSRSVLSPSDPAEVARRAAWHVLNRDVINVRPIAFARLSSKTNERLSSERFAQLIRPTDGDERLEVAENVTKGQEQIALFFGTPCGTRLESSSQAGRFGLMLTALANRTPRGSSTSFIPIVTADLMGIAAATSRNHPRESPEDQARRLVRDVARALLAPLTTTEIAVAREHLLARFGEPDRGVELALEQASGGQLSWVTPFGTWNSLAALPTASLEPARRQFAAQSRELALLLNSDDEQVEIIKAGLTSALRPLDEPIRPCRDTPPSPRAGYFKVSTAADASKGILAIPFAGGELSSLLARQTTYLLNRIWLPMALVQAGLVGDARAKLFGGDKFGMILIELSLVEREPSTAIAQARALLARLAEGAVTEADLALLASAEARVDAERSLSPVQRLLDLALAPPSEAREPPSLELLRQFHARVFDDHALTVVEVTRRGQLGATSPR